jgi:DNA-binding NarL/FixJ family response regulator
VVIADIGSSNVTTVMIIDDDIDFQEVLKDVFATSPEFKIIGTFSTLEQFAESIPQDHEAAQSFLADLLVLDVMSSGETGSWNNVDGATVATLLRQTGLKFAVLLVSSMKSHHFELYGHRKNWEFVRKSSRLSPNEILHHARLAIASEAVN